VSEHLHTMSRGAEKMRFTQAELEPIADPPAT
jgi:hypothetical protein